MKKKCAILCCLLGIVLLSHIACEKQPLSKLEKFALSHTVLVLRCGETATLEVKEIFPEGYKLKSVQWKSASNDVATVSEFGKVEALSVGETVITATSEGVSATCKLTVEGIEVESITLDKEELTLEVGKVHQLRATIAPDDASDKTLIWSSGDEKVASVSSDGEVKGLAVGETEIKVTSASGKASATCKLTVEGIEVESITLDKEELTLEVGKVHQLRATIAPDDASDKTLIWSSEDEKVASVSSDGEVKGLAVGETVIKATSASGKASATCAVSVSEKTYAVLSKLHLPFIEWGKSVVDVRKYEADNGGTETGVALYDDFEETYCFSFSVEPTDDTPIVYRGYIMNNEAGDKLSGAIITFPLETIMRVLPNGGGEIRPEFTELMKKEGFTELSFPFPGVVRAYANKARNLLIQLNIVTFGGTGTKQFSSFTIIPYDSLF